jgi:hypothetical protein
MVGGRRELIIKGFFVKGWERIAVVAGEREMKCKELIEMQRTH